MILPGIIKDITAMKDYALKPGIVLQGKSYNYTIERILGKGAFGITYLAGVQMKGSLGSLDAHINVAIKEFFMRDFNGREDSTVTYSGTDDAFSYYKSKFIHEAENLSKLRHPGIIRVIEQFEANQTAYYVMEFLPNGSFDEYIASMRNLPEQDCIDCAMQLCQALKYMHDNRMLHLDLKPNNIMINSGNQLVLIDFGLSKRFDQYGAPETSTTIGLGTAGYAPLEQSHYQGTKDDGFPATMDVYALGATMFKMLTGHRPPEASIILNDGFPNDALEAAGVSEALAAVVRKCMEPVRKNRYKTMDEVIEALAPLSTKKEDDVLVAAEVPEEENDDETTSYGPQSQHSEGIPQPVESKPADLKTTKTNTNKPQVTKSEVKPEPSEEEELGKKDGKISQAQKKQTTPEQNVEREDKKQEEKESDGELIYTIPESTAEIWIDYLEPDIAGQAKCHRFRIGKNKKSPTATQFGYCANEQEFNNLVDALRRFELRAQDCIDVEAPDGQTLATIFISLYDSTGKLIKKFYAQDMDKKAVGNTAIPVNILKKEIAKISPSFNDLVTGVSIKKNTVPVSKSGGLLKIVVIAVLVLFIVLSVLLLF